MDTIVVFYIVALLVVIIFALREIPEDKKMRLGGYVAAGIGVALIAILFGGVFYGALAEEETREVPGYIVSVEGDKVTVNTEEGEYAYYADLSVRLILWKDEVIDAVLEERVKATLTGFDLSKGTFILETAKGEYEDFFLEEADYNLGDKYFVYYAEGYAPRCEKVEK